MAAVTICSDLATKQQQPVLQRCKLFRGEVWLHRLKEEPWGNLTSSWTDYSVLPISNPGPHRLLLLLNPDFPKGSMHTGTHCMIVSFWFFHFSKSLAYTLSTFCLPKTVDTSCPFSFYCVFIIFLFFSITWWSFRMKCKCIYSTSHH